MLGIGSSYELGSAPNASPNQSGLFYNFADAAELFKLHPPRITDQPIIAALHRARSPSPRGTGDTALVVAKSWRIALLCAAGAVAVSGAAALFTIGFAGWEPSILVRMSKIEPMSEIARSADRDFVFVSSGSHFDGVYFYAIALDPFARNDDVYTRIDLYQYRYGHPGYGWVSGLFALGDPARLPWSMLLVALASMGAGAWAVSRIADHLGHSPWWGLLVAANPGLVFSVTVLCSEPLGVALAAVGLLLWLRGSFAVAAAVFAGACLVKELFILVPAGLFLWEAIRSVQHRAVPGIPFRMVVLAASTVPLALWYLYLRVHFGVFPALAEPGNLGMPLVGWFETFGIAVRMSRGGASQIGTFTITLLTITGAAMLVGVVRALRIKSPFDVMFLLSAVLFAMVNWKILLFPKDVIRGLMMVPLLLPAVIAGVDWKPWPDAPARASRPMVRREEYERP